MIHPTEKVSEEVNRKLPVTNTMIQLLSCYSDPERHNAQRYRRSDRGQTIWWYQERIILSAVRSSKNNQHRLTS